MRLKIGIFAVISILASTPLTAELIKKSKSGLCHPPESAWYDRTQSYTGFDSLQECLDSGGRLPSGITLNSHDADSNAKSGKADYQRSAFGHGWDDADGDCQNARAEALIETSTVQPVQFASDDRCRVTRGRWISPFTGKVIQNSSNIDIDHVVPLAWAWEHGAWQWSDEKRERFANDLTHLWPVELGLNRSKGAQGPDEWLPPTGKCSYVSRFVRTAKKYELSFTNSESRWVQDFLNRCG
ncbi:MAG: HNH endonuclease [Alteromonadaceae bacterium]|nr:HNH endonuclease [Alteromonadaceae bacterium]